MLPATNVRKECLFLLGTITNISCGKIVMSGEILVASVDDKSGTPLKCSKSTVRYRSPNSAKAIHSVSPLFTKNLITSTLHSASTSSGSHWYIFLLSSSNLSFFSQAVLSQLSSTTLSSELSPEAPSGGGRRRQRRAAHGALPSSVHNGGAGQIERRRCWADVAAALGEAARSGSSSSVATRARPERQLGSQIQVGLAGSSRGRRRRARQLTTAMAG
ncbi:Os03g0726200 [Oryza sativa Japonica Group]|jgi:hypothetical protein|uniref:Uncharacterized protein n=2 Tax=Oryza sativa subsp. japonica TaxID=39947 RepID=A0A8J8YIR4_ORYSJ|nr:hypothetical protein OsJ_12421 [Oryza sativa Japonica Group]KAB8093380.1 hypothetical protein EE612_020168 [Oryza sativa]BAS86175.1 Os03g0726200 [Oryza sativa Japonica Group]